MTEIIVNLIVTWVIGLTPPLVIRHAIVGRPLGKRAATVIAICQCGLFWLGFRAVEYAEHQKFMTKGFVWFFIFFAAREIMTAGSRTAQRWTYPLLSSIVLCRIMVVLVPQLLLAALMIWGIMEEGMDFVAIWLLASFILLLPCGLIAWLMLHHARELFRDTPTTSPPSPSSRDLPGS